MIEDRMVTLGPRGLVQTRTGILIGSGYVRKPAEHSADADAIQAALLAPEPGYREEEDPAWIAAVLVGIIVALLVAVLR